MRGKRGARERSPPTGRRCVCAASAMRDTSVRRRRLAKNGPSSSAARESGRSMGTITSVLAMARDFRRDHDKDDDDGDATLARIIIRAPHLDWRRSHRYTYRKIATKRAHAHTARAVRRLTRRRRPANSLAPFCPGIIFEAVVVRRVCRDPSTPPPPSRSRESAGRLIELWFLSQNWIGPTPVGGNAARKTGA
jgi:hypothetical protein